jgi:hypothetical protein
MEPVNLDVGMKLLHAVKELGLNVSRTSLDFLLSACVKAKDSPRAQQIWTEYESSGLLHNVLTSLRLVSFTWVRNKLRFHCTVEWWLDVSQRAVQAPFGQFDTIDQCACFNTLSNCFFP